MSKKIFDAMDANKNNSIDKKEMMALVNAFFQGIPKEALKMIKQMGGSESEMKADMLKTLFYALDLNYDDQVTFEGWNKAVCDGKFGKAFS